MNKKIQVHWLYSKGPEVLTGLLANKERRAICLDKDPIATMVLRGVLNQLDIIPTEELRIHLWTIVSDSHHYFFIDDEQNTYVSQGLALVCST
jgi:hypothetical protein